MLPDCDAFAPGWQAPIRHVKNQQSSCSSRAGEKYTANSSQMHVYSQSQHDGTWRSSRAGGNPDTTHEQCCANSMSQNLR
eukprot:11872353-Karenia_brevis.AAC.1